MTAQTFAALARGVIETEAEAVAALADRIDESFAAACRLILDCTGRVVVTGMGKSGHIGGKIAATLASTGTPAFFVHPGEASHGDLGMITAPDLVLAISNSGETPEIITILPVVKRMGVFLVTLTGKPDSTLGRQSDVVLDVSVTREACPLNLAPTSSTTATLVMGDALAVALLHHRGFTADDFARAHPGGTLGRRLLLYVDDVMHNEVGLPMVDAASPLPEALVEMNAKGLGMTGVTDAEGRLIGVFTDGDLRRALARTVDVYACRISEVMTRNPRTVASGTLAAEALKLMQAHSINGLFVVGADGRACGALNMHDLLRAGVV